MNTLLPKSSRATSTQVGDMYEVQIFDILQREIEEGRFFAKSECCQLFRKKGYHSRDRNGEIVFDISIEISMPGAESYSMLVLVECKKLGRRVSVDDVEEFFAKLQQVGAARCKGIVVSPGGFQSGALEFARAKGFGLIRYFSNDSLKWELRRSPVASRWRDDDVEEIRRGLVTDEYEDATSTFYCLGPSDTVVSVNELLARYADGLLDDSFLQSVPTVRTSVRYMAREDIEREVQRVLASVGYGGGAAPLEAIEKVTGVDIIRGVTPGQLEIAYNVLGRIVFDQATTITLYDHPNQPSTRTRFTLAHELGHYLLGHEQYVSAEYCDGGDQDFGLDRRMVRGDIKRLEWQANQFASSLLLPTQAIERDIAELATKLDLKDRGHGLIYVDHQPVNLGIFYRVTSELKQRYSVSRAVVRNRLLGLGVLTDARDGAMRKLSDSF